MIGDSLKALKLSVFILLLLLIAGLVVERAIYPTANFVHDHLASVRKNGDVLRILIDREFYSSKTAIYGHQTHVRTKKTELYVAEINANEILESTGAVKFSKVGELKGQDEIGFLEFFTIDEFNNYILTAATDNIDKDELCEYYDGNCEIEEVNKEEFYEVIDGSYEFEDSFYVEDREAKLKLFENNKGLNSIEIYVDHNLTHSFDYYRYAHSDKKFDLRILVKKE